MKSLRALLVAAWLLTATALTAPPVIEVGLEEPRARIQPTMVGIFFEDINSGADGGLCAELVKNASFEFDDPWMGWRRHPDSQTQGAWAIGQSAPLNASNPNYLRVEMAKSVGEMVLENEGFNGMGLRKGEVYDFSLFARLPAASKASIRAELLGSDGRVLGSARVGRVASEWARHSTGARCSGTDPKGRLRIVVEGEGALELDMISLCPRGTWKRRPHGLRADLVSMLAELKPGFLRFPGGCIVEGRRLSTRYQWKTTIGLLEQRKLIINRWNDEFRHRPAPDYFQSFGLGFFEYFVLAEDLGAEPLPILNCGMACQFNSAELVPLEQLDPYIQDALDLIEFANGPVSSPWGARRAALGHPAPFGLKFLGVGNEQWGKVYLERYERFAAVLKSRHPEIQLVASAGPRPDDELFHELWPRLRELRADIVDEHCYATPDWFLNNAGRYDSYPRQGPKVFMGEYAAQSVKVVSPDNRNDWGCALAEAAYLTGLERNADVVVMSAYAPLLAHAERWQWKPDLIWFDNLRVCGTPSYYVQQLFGRHRGDWALPIRVLGQPKPTAQEPGLYACASRDDKTREVIIKVVNSAPQAKVGKVTLKGAGRASRSGKLIELVSQRLSDENNLDRPHQVAPMMRTLSGLGASFDHAFPAYSMSVIRFGVRSGQ